jgi:molybdate transport system substrate-binding protein
MTIVVAMRRSPRFVISAVALFGFLAAACGSDDSDSTATTAAATAAAATGDVVVFAASSLTEAFGEMADAFTAENPDVNVTFNFAGSGDLVTQITEGAPADVFVSADDSNMTKITDAGQNAGEPVVIAKNTFEIIVEKGNPKGITGVADLANPDLIVVLCADTVPCGKGAAKILENAAVSVTPKSLEDKVKGVVTKVTAGEADAGIVFVTDVNAAGDAAEGVAIPDDINVISNYPIVVTKDAPNAAAAQAFVDFVASDAGQAILAKYGFLAP